MIFSFTKHPIEYILSHHFSMFYGAQKIVAIFYNEKQKGLSSIVKNKKQEDDLNISDFTDEIMKYRLNNTPYTWFDENTLPFRVRQSGIFQQDLFKEVEKTVLLLKVPNQTDNKFDLLFVYFDKRLSGLSLASTNDIKLTGNTKALVAKMLYNSVHSIISDAKKNQNLLSQTFNPGTRSIIQSHKKLNSDYINLQSQFNNTFVKLVKSIFYRYLDKDNCSISLSESAIRKLISFYGNFDELERLIENTVSYISTLYLGDLPELLEIEDYYINTDVIKQDHNETSDRYTKTVILLDNLNEAVKLVMAHNQNPTGNLVGAAMRKPISAPAITDALKNHKSKILTLLDRYPNRWTELKQFFKPIQNINIYQTNSRRLSV